MAEQNIFPFGPDGADSDTHRRVAANCTRPKSATEIAYYNQQLDPNVNDDAYHRTGVQRYLDELEEAGLVKNIGPIDDPEAALQLQNDDDELHDFYGNPEAWYSRARHPLRFPFLEHGEDHYVQTRLAHEKLIGEAPSSDAATGVAQLNSAASFAQQERNGNE